MKKIMGILMLSSLVVSNSMCVITPPAATRPATPPAITTSAPLATESSKPGIMQWWTIAGATAGGAFGAGLGMISAYTGLKNVATLLRLTHLESLRQSILNKTGNAFVASVGTPIIIIASLTAAGAISGNAVGLIGHCASRGRDTLGKDLEKNGIAGWGGAFVTGVAAATVAGVCLGVCGSR